MVECGGASWNVSAERVSMKIREEPWIVLGKCLATNCARTSLPQETSSIVTIRLTLA
jgi:hypothetical protein